METATIILILDFFGVVVFAITGSLVARTKELDWYGVVVIASVTALGGGTIRDVMLGNTPVFWIQTPIYLVATTLTALATVLLYNRIGLPRRLLLLADAFGLAIFSVIGTEVSLLSDVHPLIAIVMGAITGTAGGMTRDLLSDEIPVILRREIYATAAIVGATVFVVLNHVISSDFATVIGVLTTLGIRLVALRNRWSLPKFQETHTSVSSGAS